MIYKFLLQLTFVSLVITSNILVLFPFPYKSHFASFKPLFQGLAHKGHQVTVISYFPQNGQIENYIDIPLNTNSTQSINELVDINILKDNKRFFTERLGEKLSRIYCELVLSNKNLKKFLSSNPKYDVILIEYFNTNCFHSIVKKINTPFIGLSTAMQMPWTNVWFGNPDNPAYIPVSYAGLPDRMTFFERTKNLILHIIYKATLMNELELMGNELSKRLMDEDVDRMAERASLLLINTHFTLSFARPLVPNMVEVGGIHLGPLKRPPAVRKIESN